MMTTSTRNCSWWRLPSTSPARDKGLDVTDRRYLKRPTRSLRPRLFWHKRHASSNSNTNTAEMDFSLNGLVYVNSPIGRCCRGFLRSNRVVWWGRLLSWGRSLWLCRSSRSPVGCINRWTVDVTSSSPAERGWSETPGSGVSYKWGENVTVKNVCIFYLFIYLAIDSHTVSRVDISASTNCIGILLDFSFLGEILSFQHKQHLKKYWSRIWAEFNSSRIDAAWHKTESVTLKQLDRRTWLHWRLGVSAGRLFQKLIRPYLRSPWRTPFLPSPEPHSWPRPHTEPGRERSR